MPGCLAQGQGRVRGKEAVEGPGREVTGARVRGGREGGEETDSICCGGGGLEEGEAKGGVKDKSLISSLSKEVMGRRQQLEMKQDPACHMATGKLFWGP